MVLEIVGVRLLPDFAAGLHETTAIVDLVVGGELGHGGSEAWLRTQAATICPEWPLPGVGESDWPRAFLMDSAGPEASDEVRTGEWTVALAVALQRWIRHPVWRGRVVDAGSGRMRLAIPWHHEEYFVRLLDVAVGLVRQWWQADPDPVAVADLLGSFRTVLEQSRAARLTPNALRLIQAAVKRSIPFRLVPNGIQFGWGANAQRMASGDTEQTSVIASLTAREKLATKSLLAAAGMPVPAGGLVADPEAAVRQADELGWPVVVKPADEDRGVGVVAAIRDEATLRSAVQAAALIGSGRVIVEKHIDGDDHRILVAHGVMMAAARRIPGGVVGDGVHTVAELVDQVNADPRRVDELSAQLKKLTVDHDTAAYLAELGLTMDSVPEPGREVPVRRTANISTGGTATDVATRIHPDNQRLAERAARIIGLDFAGVDFLTPDITRSWQEVGGAICEVNPQPCLSPHWIADPDRDISGEVLEAVFGGHPCRIRTAAVTGTTGTSTTTAMLHRIWMADGLRAGMCGSAGVWIGDERISADDLSGYRDAVTLLTDPEVEAIVLELSCGDMLEFGHPCDRYDVVALLDATDDQMMAELVERATGAVVLNAEDQACLAVRSRAGTDRHILVAQDPATAAEHRRNDGEAVVLGQHDHACWITLCRGEAETPLMPANGSDSMFAAALAWAQGIDVDVIRRALSSFTDPLERSNG